MRYKVQKIFKWFEQFDKSDIKIKGQTKEFDIEIRDKYLPHLLGLQYINSNNNIIKRKRLYSYIKDNNLSFRVGEFLSLQSQKLINSLTQKLTNLNITLSPRC